MTEKMRMGCVVGPEGMNRERGAFLIFGCG